MVFWASVLVFIASIMTYLMYPRSDQYVQETYEAEGEIASFVNQHQAARNYMRQKILLNNNGANFQKLPYGAVVEYLPLAMKQKSYNEINDELRDDDVIGLDLTNKNDVFASAVVCLNADWDIETCTFDSPHQYVVTYGYIPDYLTDKTERKSTWLKALLRRTRGSASCGLIHRIGEKHGQEYYAINTSQRLTGVQQIVLNSKRHYYIPTVMKNKLETYLPVKEFNGQPYDSQLLCLSPFENPYTIKNLVYMYDKYADDETPLKSVSQTLDTYTIEGVIGTVWSGNMGDFIRISGNDNNYTLEIGDLSSDIGSEKSIKKLPFTFSYVGTPSSHTLYINGEKVNESNSAAQSYNVPSGKQDNFKHLRVYEGELNQIEIQNNVRADNRRLGTILIQKDASVEPGESE